MTKHTLTAATIDALPHPETGQKFYWDAKQSGFGVRITPSAKAYIVQNRVGGKTRRVKLASVGTLTVNEARKEAQKQLGQMATGTDPNAMKAEAKAKSQSFGHYVDLYLSSRDLKAASAKHYRDCMGWYLDDWQSRQIKDISPTDVVKRFDKLTKTNGASVANVTFRYFRAIYNHARAVTKTTDGTPTLPENPADRLSDLKRWHAPKRRTDHLTDDLFPEFFDGLKTVKNLAFADYAEILLRCGLRRNEAATLLWSDVNMKVGTFTVRAEIAKNKKALTLPMSDQVRALFQRRREAAPEAEAVFATSARYDPRKSVSRLRQSLSGDITLHGLRRSFAVLAERTGMPYSLIKRAMNHSTTGDVTAGYLVSDDPETLRPHLQAISDKIDELSKI